MTFRTALDRARPWARAAALRLQSVPRALVLAVMTALLVAIGLLLVQSAMSQRAARDSASSEADTQVALERLNQTLVDAETGQRGYLLTLDPNYLEPYNRAVRQVRGQLDDVELRFMSNTDPRVKASLDPLEGLIRDKLDELGKTVRAAQAGDQAGALQTVRTGDGKRLMDRIRANLATLRQVQHDSRNEAFSAADRADDRVVPLMLAMWLVLLALLWTGYHGEQARARAELGAAQAEQLRELNARNELLARELAHRVRNLFGVVLSLVGFSSRKPGTTAEVLADITERIHALSRAHNMATGDVSGDADLAELLSSLGKPYQTAGGEAAFICSGASVTVPARMVTPLALLFHELATNAAKYGALSVPEGRVRIAWQDAADKDTLRIEWREEGGPPPGPERTAESPKGGFGQRMTSAAVQQIGGTLLTDFLPAGAVIVLEIPRGEPDPA